MSYLMILIPVSIGMGLIGLGAFFWALTHHQYDDPQGDAQRVLNAEDRPATHRRHGRGGLPDDGKAGKEDGASAPQGPQEAP